MTPLQQRLLDMLGELLYLFDEYHLTYYVAGGTTLGAIRHKGFIPWDDDVDLMMPREDWRRLVELARAGILADKRALCCRELYPEYPNAFGRYVDETSSFIHPNQLLGGTAEGVAIDIFVLDPVPDAGPAYAVHRETLALYSDLANPLGYSYPMVSDYEKLKAYERRMRREGRTAVLDELQSELERYPEDSDFLVMRWGAAPRLFRRDLFAPERLEPFEHLMVRVPGQCAEYLNYHYGDNWAEIPPGEGRLSHDAIVSLDVDYKTLQADYLQHMNAANVKRSILLRRSFHINHVGDLRLHKNLEAATLAEFAKQVTQVRASAAGRLDELLERGGFAELEHVFQEFYRWQTSHELEGREEYLHIFRYHHPVLIDLDENLMRVALLNLVDTNRIGPANRIMRIIQAVNPEIASRLHDVSDAVALVRLSGLLQDQGLHDNALEAAQRALAKRPNNFTARLKCLEILAGTRPFPSADVLELAQEGLKLFPEAGEFLKFSADAHLAREYGKRGVTAPTPRQTNATHSDPDCEDQALPRIDAAPIVAEYRSARSNTANFDIATAAASREAMLANLHIGPKTESETASTDGATPEYAEPSTNPSTTAGVQRIPTPSLKADELLGLRTSQLLAETATTLEHHGIEFFLGPQSARLALTRGCNDLNYPVLDLMTPAENIPIIADILLGQHEPNRAVDCWKTNANYPAFQLDYVDTTTTFLQLEEGDDLCAHGVKTRILPTRMKEAGLPGALTNTIAAGWQLNGYRQPKSPSPSTLAKAALARATMIGGKAHGAQRLFDASARTHVSSNGAKAIHAGDYLNNDAGRHATVRYIRFNGEDYPIATEAETILEQNFGPNWADVPEWRSTYKRVLAAPDVPYPDLERGLQQAGVPLAGTFALMRKIRMQMLPLAPALRARNKAIREAHLSAKRLASEGRAPVKAAFVIPYLARNAKRRTIAISGTVKVTSPYPLQEGAYEFLFGKHPANAACHIMRSLHRSGSHQTIIRMRAEIGMDDLRRMPIHNPLHLRCLAPDGTTHQVRVRWIAALPKYLALHGPLLADEGSGLVAFFRQNIDKNTMLTVRHANRTDSSLAHIKIGVAWALAKMARWIDPIILYEKNARHYEESARIVFEQLVDEGRNDVWFVLDGDVANDLDIPEPYRRQLLVQHSFRHYLYFFRSTRFLGTEALPHCFELRCQSILVQRKLRSDRNRFVFLQHGVMYMVSLDSPERSFFRKRNMPGKVRIVASSELEAQHFVELAGFERDDIIVSGLPKFDRSYQNPGADKILIMPTWRPWEFARMRANPMETGYAKMVKRLVDAVPAHLRENVIVVPHPLFDPALFGASRAANAEATPGPPDSGTHDASSATGKQTNLTVSLDTLLRDVALLVTDYSSISYDAFYRGANVIFYWEELADCMAHYGEPTHLMLDEQSAFGPVCHTAEELTRAVDALYGKPQDKAHLQRYRRIVEYHDGGNTERLVDAIRGFID